LLQLLGYRAPGHPQKIYHHISHISVSLFGYIAHVQTTATSAIIVEPRSQELAQEILVEHVNKFMAQ
jgi:hypothetical protein